MYAEHHRAGLAATLLLYLSGIIEDWNGAVPRAVASVPLLWVAALGWQRLQDSTPDAATAP